MKVKFNSFKLFVLLLIITPFFSGILKNSIYMMSIIVATFILFSYLQRRKFSLRNNREDIFISILLTGMSIVAYAIFNVVLNGISLDAVEKLLQLYLCCTVLLVAAEYNVKYSDYKFCIFLIQIVAFICLLMWPISGFRTNYFSGIFSRGNSLGGALFCYLGILFMVPRRFNKLEKITGIIIFFLVYIANSRSSQIAIGTFLFFMWLFKKIKILHNHIVFWGMIAAFTLFPIFYIALYNSQFKDILNTFSWTYSRKRFFSGRQYLWGDIVLYIRLKPLFGYGLGVTPETLIGGVWSAHNWYIQVILQMGIIGYGLVVNIIQIIWSTLLKLKKRIACVNTSAFIMGVLVWQCFEVAITQNNFSIGVLVWLVMGLGLNNSVNDAKSV